MAAEGGVSKMSQMTVMKGDNYYNENSDFQRLAISVGDVYLLSATNQIVSSLLKYPSSISPSATLTSSPSGGTLMTIPPITPSEGGAPEAAAMKKRNSTFFSRLFGGKDKGKNKGGKEEIEAEEEPAGVNSLMMERKVPKTLNIADLGCSQGGNSQAPTSLIISEFRKNPALAEVPFCVFHIDQATNDWNSFWMITEGNQNSYVKKHKNVFVFTEGKSFYESLFPPESIHMIYSFASLMWLSRRPEEVITPALYCHELIFDPKDYADWGKIAEDDFDIYLTHRANELVKGGKMVLSFLAAGEEIRKSKFGSILQALVDENTITLQEAKKFTCGIYSRSKEEIERGLNKHWDNLKVEKLEITTVIHPLYESFKAGNVSLEQFGKVVSGFYRAVSEAPMNGALGSRTASEKIAIVDRFWELFLGIFDGDICYVTSTMAYIQITKI